MVLGVALCGLAIFQRSLLPDIVAASGSYTQLSQSPVALVVEAVCLAALGLYVTTTRLRLLLDLWLTIALLAGLIDVTLTLFAGARYSVGWYAARVASMVSSSAVLGMLLYQTSGLYRNLTETHRRLIEASARDGLTGVFNRAYFDDRYRKELALAASSDYPLSVLLIDVGHFKTYNDTFGHLAGDDCLRSVAGTLAATLRRQGDFIARYGGEEFVVVLPACEPDVGLAIGERMRAAVIALEFEGPSPAVPAVTVSIGHASSAQCAQASAEAILRHADAGP